MHGQPHITYTNEFTKTDAVIQLDLLHEGRQI